MSRREETVRRYGGNGDNWHMSWASDDQQYVSMCDGAGFSKAPRPPYNSRMLILSGGAGDARFHDLKTYPTLGAPAQGPADPRYYNFGTLALDGALYQFLSTFNRPFESVDVGAGGDSKDPVRFNGVKLIYSPDNGRTWRNQNGSSPVVWESWAERSRATLVFFEEDQDAFSLLSVLQMGKNYQNNRDGYVYVYSPNGSIDGTMNELVLFRVPKMQILRREAYEYFAGIGASAGAKWTKNVQERAVVHTFPRGWVNSLTHPFAWLPSVVYNAALGLYMMASWGMGTGADGRWFAKPSYLGIWTGAAPWGPWEQIHEETAWLPAGDANARAFAPQIVPKWLSEDGKSFWLAWSDFQVTDQAEYDPFNKEIGEKWVKNQLSERDWVRIVEMQRRHKPYYAFNVQRVDLTVM